MASSVHWQRARGFLIAALGGIAAGAVLFGVAEVFIYAGLRWGMAAVGTLVGAVGLFGQLFARALFQLGGGIRDMAADHALARWSGKYYVFERHHIRLWGDDEGQHWFAAKDIVEATGKTFNPRLLGRYLDPNAPSTDEGKLPLMTLTTARLYLSHTQTEQARKFVLWFEREVAFPLLRAEEQRRQRLGLPPLCEKVEAPTDFRRDQF